MNLKLKLNPGVLSFPSLGVCFVLFFSKSELSREEGIREATLSVFRQAGDAPRRLPVECMQSWLFLACISALLFVQCEGQAANCIIALQNRQLNAERNSEMETLSVSVRDSSYETNCSVSAQSISHQDERTALPTHNIPISNFT